MLMVAGLAYSLTWRERQYIYPKCYWTSTVLHGVTFQKIATLVGASDPTYYRWDDSCNICFGPYSVSRLSKCFMYSRKFPVQTVRCSNLVAQKHVTKELLEENANSTYPVVHESVLFLYIHFLEHKKQYGIGPERELYANMGILNFVQRLLEKRSAAFFAKNDKYLLVSGAQGCSGWEAVGSVIFLKNFIPSTTNRACTDMKWKFSFKIFVVQKIVSGCACALV